MSRFHVAIATGTTSAHMELYIPRYLTTRKVGINPPLKNMVKKALGFDLMA